MQKNPTKKVKNIIGGNENYYNGIIDHLKLLELIS